MRAFATVIDEGTFSAAARALGYTQSAISQQIGALERIVGTPVLHRPPGGRRPLELTDAGRVVLTHARPLLARVRAAEADVAALAGGEVGEVKVRTFQSFGGRMLPGVLAAFRRRCPGAEVHIEEALTGAALFDSVESGEVDVSFAGYPLPEGPFAVRELLDDPYVMVTRSGDDVHTLGDLSGRRLLGIRGCQHTQAIEMQMMASGVAPESWARFDNNAIIQALVASGEGVAIVPELVLDAERSGIDVLPLPELPARRLIAVWHRERTLSAAAREFVEAAAEACAA